MRPVLQARLLACFWEGVSAEKAARMTGVNRKTALTYFRRFRLAIARLDSPVAPPSSPAASTRTADPGERSRRTPVFGIQEGVRAVRVLLPGEAQTLGGARNASISWVYAPSPEAARRLNLDAFFHLGRQEVVRWHGRAQISRADLFWQFARNRLKSYRGGYRADFALFLKEMAYRFNARTSSSYGLESLKRALAR